MNRRNFLRCLTGASAPAFLDGYRLRAAALRNKVKITDVKVMLVQNQRRLTPFIRIDTDADVSGIGEAYWGYGVKEIILGYLKELLVGEDPVAVDLLYTKMINGTAGAGSTGGVTVTAVSGVEIALWDLVGKLLDAPVYALLGGSFHDGVRAYWTTGPGSTRAEISEFKSRLAEHPFGFTALKVGFVRTPDPQVAKVRRKSLSRHMSLKDLKANRERSETLRDVLGDEIEFSIHCHWEFDWPDALELARAVAPGRPWFLEDPMPPDYSDSWVNLTAASPVPILMGENVYTRHGFKPFIINRGCHLVQIDIPKSGGLLESKKISDLADLFYMPVCAHNVATPLGTVASAHAAASMRNFRAHEVAGLSEYWEDFVVSPGPIVKGGRIQLYDRPGLGVELNEDVVRSRLADGETWWG